MKSVVLLAFGESAESHGLEKALSDHGHVVIFVHSTDAALRALDGAHPDGLVAEFRSARIDGVAILRRGRALRPDVSAVLVGADDRAVDEGIRQGAADVQAPPVHVPKLLRVLESGFARQAALRKVEQLETSLDEKFGFERLAGHGSATMQMIKQARRAAETDERVLLVGPPGSGKATLARAIHQNSKRGKGPFIRAKAATDKALRDAKGGTLYVENTTALPPLDPAVRILASATDEFPEAREGFELIIVPPLNERLDDLPLLVDLFFVEFNRVHGRRVSGVTRGALEQLSAYDWPGNVRELESVIEGMVVFADGRRQLDVSDIPYGVRNATRPERQAVELPLSATLAEVEKRFMQETLVAVSYDKPRAAAALGIGLRTLYRKLKEYEIG